jgi:hypothetical protein
MAIPRKLSPRENLRIKTEALLRRIRYRVYLGAGGTTASGVLLGTTLRHFAVAFGKNVVIVSLCSKEALNSGRITAAIWSNCR